MVHLALPTDNLSETDLYGSRLLDYAIALVDVFVAFTLLDVAKGLKTVLLVSL
ncbi:hypothetical protein OMCYN_01613 [cyanobiont of Ornithocercus magnificus]|nr:hypothetical protein OMCYN_01613 [cyanobiont of Ornithocercus magnificus]